MKNILKAGMVLAAISVSGIASAATFSPSSGSFVYEGNVTVVKDGPILGCDLRITIDAAAQTAAAAFVGGDLGCTFINVSGAAAISLAAGSPETITFGSPNWYIIPPFSPDHCSGAISAQWFDASPTGTSPSRIVATSASTMSPAIGHGGSDCIIVGTLNQVTAGTQLQIQP